MSQSKAYEDEQFVWTPANNQSIKNYERAEDLFDVDEKSRVISIIVDSKGDNLLTIDAFKEMLDYQEMLFGIEEFRKTTMNEDTNEAERPSEGVKVSFKDICRSQSLETNTGLPVDKCFNTGSPLEFIYELDTNSYAIEDYKTDEDLLDKIKLGKLLPEGRPLIVKNFMAETVPEEIEQD